MEDAVNALIATVIVIGSRGRVDEAASALDRLSDRAGVRRVLISEGTSRAASADEKQTTIRIDGLSPQYVDNAVAWLRLSNLPAVVWWRGGSPDALDRLAHLADRLVLDTDPGDEMWPRAPTLFERTALSDLHWGSLTRWRAAVAHLFDLPDVRNGAAAYRELDVEASDRSAARLFAGWLQSCLAGTTRLVIRIADGPRGARTPLTRVRLSGGGPALTLHVQRDRTCLEAEVEGAAGVRVVPLGDGALATRFAEEIGVRSRDAAFERALVAAMEMGV
jgi:glucose-6-phosphate dehydrogenase assembly protein OpcA